MEKLKEDYERRLQTVMNEINRGGNDQDTTIYRLSTKASCYRTFIAELNKLIIDK